MDSDSEDDYSDYGFMQQKASFVTELPVIARAKSKTKLKKQNSAANRFKQTGYSNDSFDYSGN